MNKKYLLVLSATLLAGIVMGASFRASPARANFLTDLWKNLIPGAVSHKENSGSENNVSKYESAPGSYEDEVIKAVEKASPAVVSVIVSKDLPVVEQCPYNPLSDLPPEFRQFFGDSPFDFSAPCDKGGATQKQEIGGGTGFIISEDGLILTNKHVVSDSAAEYTVLTNDGNKYTAKVLARDPAQDLAVLKIKANGLKTVELGDSSGLRLGQTAIAIGNALGQFKNTVSVGVVSGLFRNITAGGASGSETIQGVIQTDAAINPGNSGGPLLNLRGEVIAINTAIVSGAQNIGFAIPINQAKRDIKSVEKTGEIKTPFLGVRYKAVNKDLADKEKLPVDFGALVRGNDEGPGVIPSSPAAKSGILAEDIITEVNGQKLDDNHPLGREIQNYNAGDEITLKLLRNGKEMTIRVVLGER